MATQKFSNCNEDKIETIARDMAIVAKTGDLITLSGDLGAGKTLFCRAFIRQYLEMKDLEVPSPTYLISIEYNGVCKTSITHMDLYRISDASELDELGLEEAQENSVVLMEWPEKAIDALPVDRLEIILAINGEFTRTLTIKGQGQLYQRYLRSAQIGVFLRACCNGRYTRKPMAADASTRDYEFINYDGKTSILMNAPKATDGPPVKNGLPYSQIAHLAEEVKPFISIANLLRSRGFYAPQIYAHDCDKGLVLMEFLGEQGIIQTNNQPIDIRYIRSGDLLASIHTQSWTHDDKDKSGPSCFIPSFDQPAMLIEVELLTDWYLGDGEFTPTGKDILDFKQIWAEYASLAQSFRKSIVLRDFHSPNIIWRSEKTGNDRIGLIDFQDAMIGPAAYDLVSLAQDARIVVPPQLESRIIKHYLEKLAASGFDIDDEQFRLEYALMGAQRASKLLGIFVRLHTRDGKSGYRKLIPAIRTYLKKNLQHPVLSGYRSWCERVIDL